MKETDDKDLVLKKVVVTVEFAIYKGPNERRIWARGINQRLSLASVSSLVRDLDDAVLTGYEYDIVATRVDDIVTHSVSKEV